MTKRDEFAGFLRSHDARKARRSEDIAFCDGLSLDQLQSLLLQANFSASDSFPQHDRFGRHIDHRGFAAMVDVGQFSDAHARRLKIKAGLMKLSALHSS